MCKNLLEPFWNELWVLRRRHHVSVRHYLGAAPTPLSAQVLMAVGVLTVIGAVAFGLWDPVSPQPVLRWLGVLGGALVLAAFYLSARAEKARTAAELKADIEEGDVDFGTGSAFYSGNDLGRSARKYGVLMIVVLFGVILPAVAIIAATDAKTFFVVQDGFPRVVVGTESRVVARTIQVIYVAILTVFPALMYFQFDQQRAGTMRSQWVRSIFRIDRRMHNLSDVNARYGDLMSEASQYRTDASRALGGRHSPLIVATILLGLGWVILVARTESFNFDRTTQATAQTNVAETAASRAEDLAVEAKAAAEANDQEAARQAAAGAIQAAETARMAANESGRAAAEADGETPTTVSSQLPSAEETEDLTAAGAADLASAAANEAKASAEAAVGTETEAASTRTFQLLVPDPSPAGMAFLGAYFFAVYLVLKAYLRGDLRPKMYNQITARLVTVVVVAYLISVLIPNEDPWIVQSLAFVAGVVPNTVLRRLGEWSTGKPIVNNLFGQAFGEDRPLTLIDGVDIYERERLATEGISDIEALAHTDLVTNMVNTRIPMERLVDWVDQAVLILHLPDADDSPEAPSAQLRRHGIRTASGFISASRSESCAELQARMGDILDMESLEPLADMLESELVMRQINQWRTSPLGRPGRAPKAIKVGETAPTIEIHLERDELGASRTDSARPQKPRQRAPRPETRPPA